MSIYDEVAELLWENGQPSKHGLSGPQQEKPTLNKARDTLESVIQQGTLLQHQKSKYIMKDHHAPTSVSSIAASSGELQAVPTLSRKRAWSNSDHCGRNFNTDTNMVEECCGLPSGCASASAGATFCRENDTTMMTWTTLESGRCFKDKGKIHEEDSACHGGTDILDNQHDRDNKAEIGQTNLKRRIRTAAIHNQSERKRRDRINQKMKALQRLVPNANKTDKASMLDEVINYLKQLQAHIQMMNMTSMPQMIAMQQQLQMSMLAKMGMVNINNMIATQTGVTRSFPQLTQPTTVGAPVITPMVLGPSFMMPSMIHARAPTPTNPNPTSSGTNASIPFPDSYSLPQPVNMNILNMEALYRHQMSQNNHALSSSLYQLHHAQGK